jgi:Cys-tRNA(Pro)/Cys-tRNA(Cys) deacylase
MPKTNAERALERAGVEYSAHEVGEDVRSGEAMAQALGVAPERVLRSLVCAVKRGGRESKAIVLVASHRRLDVKRLARGAGADAARLAEVAEAERWTGMKQGGISALGQSTGRFEVFVDASALQHATVFCSAGRRGLDLELAPGRLVAALDAAIVDLDG